MVRVSEFELPYGIKDIHGHSGFLREFNVPDGDGDALAEAIAHSGIEQACFAPFLGLTQDAEKGNRSIQALSARHCSIRGLAVINPFDGDETERELRYCFEENSFAALQFHPQNAGVPDAHPGYEAALSYANEHSIAVLWHYGGGAEYIGELSRRYKNTNFILEHYGTCWDGYSENEILDILRLVRKYDNVYTDIAGSQCIRDSVSKVVQVTSAEKLLFGSDIGFLDGAYQVGYIIRAKIPDEEKYAIMRGNYEKLVK